MVSKSYLIFTDLDGTLINHQSYSLGVNDKIIKKLTQNSHQVIINSSKTFTEIKKLVSKLYLSNMPFSYPPRNENFYISLKQLEDYIDSSIYVICMI